MKISDYIPRSLSKVTIADLLVGIQEISFWLLLDNTYFQATLRHSLTCWSRCHLCDPATIEPVALLNGDDQFKYFAIVVAGGAWAPWPSVAVVLGCKKPPQLGRSNVIGARQMLADLDATCCCCRCCRLLSICIKNVLHFIWPRPASASMGKRPNSQAPKLRVPSPKTQASRKCSQTNRIWIAWIAGDSACPWLLPDFLFFRQRLSKLHTKLF